MISLPAAWATSERCLARGVPGVLGSLLKLFLLVVVFAAFGALAAFVVIAGMTLRP